MKVTIIGSNLDDKALKEVNNIVNNIFNKNLEANYTLNVDKIPEKINVSSVYGEMKNPKCEESCCGNCDCVELEADFYRALMMKRMIQSIINLPEVPDEEDVYNKVDASVADAYINAGQLISSFHDDLMTEFIENHEDDEEFMCDPEECDMMDEDCQHCACPHDCEHCPECEDSESDEDEVDESDTECEECALAAAYLDMVKLADILRDGGINKRVDDNAIANFMMSGEEHNEIYEIISKYFVDETEEESK